MKKLMEKALKRAMGSKKENGKKGLKGFTLVEIIVVLVILAILAAAMIPALTGYIDKAKEKTAISEARSVLTAAQTIVSEKYATATDNTFDSLDPDELKKVLDLAEIKTTDVSDTISSLTISQGKVETFVYNNSTSTVTYTDGNFVVTKKSTT